HMAEMAVATVPAMQGSAAIIRMPAVGHYAAVPVDVPCAPSPTAATTAHHCADGNACPKRDHAGGGYVPCRVAGHYIGRAIDDGGVVLWHVDDLRIRRVNHDRGWRLLHYLDLLSRFQIAGSLGLRAYRLNRRHHVLGLEVIDLAQLRGPGKIFGHIVQNSGKRGESLHAGIPALLIHFLHKILAAQVLVILEPVLSQSDLIGER